jgi:tRNA(fMet)-specific endonuclease VapC
MIDYFLDTNACIALINGSSAQVRRRFRQAINREKTIAVSSVVAYELWYGVHKSQRREFNSLRLEAFLAGPLTLAPFEEEDARVAGEIRAELERAGKPIGAYDTQIAGQTKRHGATLVTSNSNEFARVTALKWTDWAAAKEERR